MKDRLEERQKLRLLSHKLWSIKDQKASLLLPKDAPTADLLLLFTVLALALFGTAMVFSAGYAYADFRYDDSTYFMKRH
jgi:cell division protein FtsW (lipid II flippase)